MNYRRLKPDELIQIGDEFNYIGNPPDSGHITVKEDMHDHLINQRADINPSIYFRRRFTPPKLVRKYRFLKPHEKIQYGDIPYSGPTPPRCYCDGWTRVGIDSSYLEGELAGDHNIVRFVDCIPAQP